MPAAKPGIPVAAPSPYSVGRNMWWSNWELAAPAAPAPITKLPWLPPASAFSPLDRVIAACPSLGLGPWSYQPTLMEPGPPMPGWKPSAASHWPMFFVVGRFVAGNPIAPRITRPTMPEQSSRAPWL
ncbi:hypothetical protein PICSAR71_00232 [Mycobacterium avium subsp. paratuberculosis]|nr:hypothetical protein PICSAR71_00232 [Mycobacterium avium subsp. paratuberculosis]